MIYTVVRWLLITSVDDLLSVWFTAWNRWIMKNAEFMSRKSLLWLSNQNRPQLSPSNTQIIHIYDHPGITRSTNKNITIPQIIPYTEMWFCIQQGCCVAYIFFFLLSFVNLSIQLILLVVIFLWETIFKAITPILFLFTTFSSTLLDPSSMELSLLGQH